MMMVIRVAVVYLTVLVGLRVLGKREFGELSPMELVSLMLIPEIVSEAITHDNPSLINGLIGLATLFGLVFATSALMYRSKRVEKLVDSVPAVLVQRGEYVLDTMQKERVTPDEIASEMRKAGLERIEQIMWAVLETDGKISIVPEEAGRGAQDAGGDKDTRAVT